MNITHIVIKRRDLSDARNQEVLMLEDYDLVQAVIEFFTKLKSGWMHPWDTVPAGEYSIVLYENDTPIQTFLISGVIVTFDENGQHLWRFSEKGDYDKLSKFIGLL